MYGLISVPTNFTNCHGDFMFHCKYQDKCVPYMFTCDGTRDCVHGSDENLDQCWGKFIITSFHSLYENKCMSYMCMKEQ